MGPAAAGPHRRDKCLQTLRAYQHGLRQPDADQALAAVNLLRNTLRAYRKRKNV